MELTTAQCCRSGGPVLMPSVGGLERSATQAWSSNKVQVDRPVLRCPQHVVHTHLGRPCAGSPSRFALVLILWDYTAGSFDGSHLWLCWTQYLWGMARGFWACLAWFASQALDDHYERIADVDVRASWWMHGLHILSNGIQWQGIKRPSQARRGLQRTVLGPSRCQHMTEAVTCSFTTTVQSDADKVGNWGFCHLPILLKMWRTDAAEASLSLFWKKKAQGGSAFDAGAKSSKMGISHMES